MKRLLAGAAAMVLIALFASHADAQTQKTVGAVPIKFSVPEGQCEVNEATKAGAGFSKLMADALAQDGETVFSIHADCSLFKRFNAGETNLTEYTIYSAPNRSFNTVYKSDFIPRACAAFESLKKKTVNDFVHDGINVSNATHMGALALEKDVCYTGMLARVTTPAGMDSLNLQIAAVVLVNGKLINYRLYAPFKDSQSVVDALARHKTSVAAFFAANGSEQRN